MGLSSRSLPSVISARPTHELYKSIFSSFRSSLSLCLDAQHPPTRASLPSPAPSPPSPSAMISTSRPPSALSSNPDADPFSALLRPPAFETDHERDARLKREADAKRISDSIDEEIKADRERMRKSKQDIRVSCASHAVSSFIASRRCLYAPHYTARALRIYPSPAREGSDSSRRWPCGCLGLVTITNTASAVAPPRSSRIRKVDAPEAVPTDVQPHWS